MLPLGLAVVTGSALLEQVNRRGLEGLALAALRDPERAAGTRPLKRRQRRAIQAELKSLSSQLHEQLNQVSMASAAEKPATETLTAKTPAVGKPTAQLSATVFPDLRQIQTQASAQVQASAQQSSPPQPTPTEVASFLAIALGTEYSPNGQPLGKPHIRKWTQDVRIRINGEPTTADLATLEQVATELNQLLSEAAPASSVKLEFVDSQIDNPLASQANLDIFFVPERDFSRYEASYQPINHGFFWSEADQGMIQRGRILISTTGVSQAERSHLIREELTQSLGLMQDSTSDANSIFFQGWSHTQAYSPQDELLLKLLYRADIRPGMDAIAVQQVLLGQ